MLNEIRIEIYLSLLLHGFYIFYACKKHSPKPNYHLKALEAIKVVCAILVMECNKVRPCSEKLKIQMSDYKISDSKGFTKVCAFSKSFFYTSLTCDLWSLSLALRHKNIGLKRFWSFLKWICLCNYENSQWLVIDLELKRYALMRVIWFFR